ncbi:MAG: endonuclease/exonuclease/phosphatase family protein [Leptolyngbya sp. SIOISBB]|nr:endonuclease/exonuclease/phosphatase family protein [Leptolyngbya sp. SIOISBB]
MLLSIILWPIALLLLLLSFASGPWYRLWPFEMIGAGYLWFAALTLILLLVLLRLKPRPPHRKVRLVMALALGLYVTTLGAWYIPRLRDARAGGVPLTVMTYNVNHLTWNTAAVTDLVRTNPVDIFGLVEPFKEQAAELRDNVPDLYPYYYRSTGGGLSLFSRYPITEATTENLGTKYHSLFAIADVNGKPVRIVVAHPLAPVSIYNFVHRNEAMVALAAYAAQQPITTIMMGDFNLTSWSIYFRDFIRHSSLRSVNLGHGLNPTWFYNGAGRSLSRREHLKHMLKIPIDHVFVSQDISVDQVITPASGVSDHRPVMAKLRMI